MSKKTYFLFWIPCHGYGDIINKTETYSKQNVNISDDISLPQHVDIEVNLSDKINILFKEQNLRIVLRFENEIEPLFFLFSTSDSNIEQWVIFAIQRSIYHKIKKFYHHHSSHDDEEDSLISAYSCYSSISKIKASKDGINAYKQNYLSKILQYTNQINRLEDIKDAGFSPSFYEKTMKRNDRLISRVLQAYGENQYFKHILAYHHDDVQLLKANSFDDYLDYKYRFYQHINSSETFKISKIYAYAGIIISALGVWWGFVYPMIDKFNLVSKLIILLKSCVS